MSTPNRTASTVSSMCSREAGADLVGVVGDPRPVEPLGPMSSARTSVRSSVEATARVTSADHFHRIQHRADDPSRRGRQAVPGRTRSRSRDLTLEIPTRRDLRPRRAVGLRQDDDPADDQPARRADVGADLPRRRTTSPHADPVELRRHIGYVIQQVGLFPHQTIGVNVATVPRLLGWIEGAHRRARRRAARARRPPAGRVPRAVSRAAVRRAAPARRRRPRARRRPAGAS